MKSSKFPVGAKWEAKEGHKLGRIRLASRSKLSNNEVFEVWWWALFDIDANDQLHYLRSDWGNTYRFCREEIPIFGNVRFKRVE